MDKEIEDKGGKTQLPEWHTPTPILSSRKKKKSRYTDAQLARALTKAYGNMRGAGRILHADRAEIARRIAKNPELQKLLIQMVDDRIDAAEESLDFLVRKRNLTACIFFLKTIGRHRGYIEHAPLEQVDVNAFKALNDFFSSVRIAAAQSPQPIQEVQENLCSLPEKIVDPVNTSHRLQSDF